MGYIIVGRNPINRNLFVVEQQINDDPENVKVQEFQTEKEAAKTAERMPIFRAWPFQIVEIDT